MSIETNAPTTTGETIERPFIRVTWQKGVTTTAGINGCRVEDVLQVVCDKLESYQLGPLACVENEDALKALSAALEALNARHQRRMEQGVLNTMDVHQTERTEDVEQDFSATGA